MNSFASPQIFTALPFSRTDTGKLPVDDLYSRIFDAILEQRIHAASRFTEDSLAQMFSARRSEIRGVLTQLSHQQIIILRTHHRPRVAAPDVEQIRQTLHARRLTEITLVRLACQQPHPQDLKRLRALIDSERQCTARGPVIRLSGEFHLQLAEMAGNAPLAYFLGSLVPLTSLAIARYDALTGDYCGWREHAEIVDAVEREDVTTAEMLMNRRLDHLEEALLNSGNIPSLDCCVAG
ncbi:GntR family transcriptional regulator [Pseudomonas frederiksbergensis]|jgi:DNA-binding GntR family transcriptional regulator|uniref:GntR family transcriptional regulator n=1 Tax=Pseudomonas frederiksbergensis TaxID=104087 RepID=A0A423J1Y6_9PSED|nr:GntR family transcriptional regulator [Pseudomonas frederiksbergensis]RON31672.1 GntR family transcriptional regulator [Pseudomonas frederiksbergensis]